MYTLRIIEETRENEKSPFEQVIKNFELGKAYTKIEKGCSSEFDRIVKENAGGDINGIRAVVCGENELVFFIMNNNKNMTYSYFIMTESGKTLERL